MTLIRIGGPPPLPVYVMDLSISEEHSFPGEATKYPVEKGADFTDHIRELPDEITLECIVSDTPIGVVSEDPTRQPVENPDGTTSTPLPSAEALQRMRELKALKQPVRIETSLGVFTSMAFVDLHVPVNKDKGPGRVFDVLGVTRPGALFFTAKFHKVVVVTNKRTKVRVRSTMAGAGGQGKAKGITIQGVTIFKVIQWRHGDPPGSPWHIPNPIEPVTVVYTPQASVAPQDRAVLMQDELSYELSGAGTGLITFLDANRVNITGDRLVALRQDLRRDRDQLNKSILNDPRFATGSTFGPTSAQSASPVTRSNLPSGVDTSKWTLPGPFDATKSALTGPGGAFGPNALGGLHLFGG